MKIVDVDTYMVDSGGQRPGTWSRCFIFVEVTTDDSITGIGEACNWPGDLSIQGGIRELRRYIIGLDPMDVERVWATMYSRTGPHGLSGVMTTAISGIDQALWDIRGKVLNAPVWKLLGGKFRDKVRVYTHAGGSTTEEIAKNVSAVMAEGYTAIKVYPFQGDPFGVSELQDAAKRMRAFREAAGWDVELAVEGGCRFNPHTAIKVGKKLEPFDPYFFEEPVPPENIDAMAKVAHHLDIPIAAGEHIYTKFGFRPLLEKEAVDIIQPDIARTGGITEMKKIAAMAESYYVPLAPHNPNGPLANYASVHLLAAIPNCAMLEWVRGNWGPWVKNLVEPPLLPEKGYVQVPDRPGLGAELNKEVVKEHLFQEERYLPKP